MKITVGKLLDDLSKYNRDDEIEISVGQYNKRYPVAYCPPALSGRGQNSLVSKENGITVRMAINLPWDNKEFMVTSIRKIK